MRKKERLMKVQCREKRLAGKRESSKKRRATENQETREKRLACQQGILLYKKKCANESADCREKRLVSKRTHQKQKRANESSKCREKRLTTLLNSACMLHACSPVCMHACMYAVLFACMRIVLACMQNVFACMQQGAACMQGCMQFQSLPELKIHVRSNPYFSNPWFPKPPNILNQTLFALDLLHSRYII